MSQISIGIVLAVVAVVVTRFINSAFADAVTKLRSGTSGIFTVSIQVEYGRSLLESSLAGRRTLDDRIVAVVSPGGVESEPNALVVSAQRAQSLPAHVAYERVVVIDDGAGASVTNTSRWPQATRVGVARAGQLDEILDLLGVNRRSPNRATLTIVRLAVLGVAYALILLIGIGALGYFRIH